MTPTPPVRCSIQCRSHKRLTARTDEAETAQRDTDGGDGPPELVRDGRAGTALTPQRLDLGLGRRGQPRRAAVRPRGAVAQAGLTFGSETLAPLAHRARAGAQRRGHTGNRPAGGQPLDHQHSTPRRGSGILMAVHPGLRVGG